jgi:hypothetical protein
VPFGALDLVASSVLVAAWFELMLIQFAFSLDIGVNKNRDSPYNMACLPGGDYSDTSPGSTYLVPVHTHITTQGDFKKVHVSACNKKKELIDAGDYEKGKHQHPELRKPSKKQDLSVRKKQDLSVRKKAGHYWTDTGNRRQSDTETQKQDLAPAALRDPRRCRHCLTRESDTAGPKPGFSASTPRRD